MKKVFLSGEKTISAVEAPVPEAAGNLVLIKTKMTGICGTDVHGYFGETIFGKIYPFHIGHEVSGVVEAVGKACKSVRVGDRVTIDPFFTCNACEFCRSGKTSQCINRTTIGLTGPGGFSDYILVPETSVFIFDSGMDFETASLAEPLACAVNGILQTNIGLGKSVLINGVGPIGQLHLLLCKLSGAAVIAASDLNQRKLDKAAELGADCILIPGNSDYKEKLEKIAPLGFDLIIDCTGVPAAVEACIPLLKQGGQLLIFGVCPADSSIRVNPFDVYKRELKITGSIATTREAFTIALKLLSSGRIKGNDLIDAVLSRDHLEDAILGVKDGVYTGKVIISTEK